jgi:putative serine protease PepD
VIETGPDPRAGEFPPPLPSPPLRRVSDLLMPVSARDGVRPTARPPRVRRGFLAVCGAIVGTLFIAVVGGVVGYGLAERADAPPRRPSTLGLSVAAPRQDPPRPLDVAAVADQVGTSVVAIQRIVSNGDQFGEASGTGIIVTSDGEIVTNAHVVGDATTVNVRLPGESEPREGGVVAVDAANDLALVRIDAEGLDAATFADPADLRVGDEVVAIGYALDLDGDPSVTLGIVSALDRTLDIRAGVLNGLVQSDAAISSGNSGGPLVDANGHVVGINTAVANSDVDTAANDVSFAIGVGQVLPELQELRDTANGVDSPEGYLGVGLERRRDGGAGALVTSVEAQSPAAEAGVQAGDVVVSADGAAVSGDGDLVGRIRDKRPGDTLVLGVLRDGEPLELTATLVARPAD